MSLSAFYRKFKVVATIALLCTLTVTSKAGDARNGPNLKGSSIPSSSDYSIDKVDLLRATKTCAIKVLRSIYRQAFDKDPGKVESYYYWPSLAYDWKSNGTYQPPRNGVLLPGPANPSIITPGIGAFSIARISGFTGSGKEVAFWADGQIRITLWKGGIPSHTMRVPLNYPTHLDASGGWYQTTLGGPTVFPAIYFNSSNPSGLGSGQVISDPIVYGEDLTPLKYRAVNGKQITINRDEHFN